MIDEKPTKYKGPVELNQDDVDWFRTHYPNGSLSGTLSMLLSAFREVNTFTPKDYAMQGAELLKSRLKNDRSN